MDRSDTAIDPGLLLLNWANALSPQQIAGCVAFAAQANIVHAGLGPLPLKWNAWRLFFSVAGAALCCGQILGAADGGPGRHAG